LSFCNSENIENEMNFFNNGVVTEINTTKIILQNEINATTPLQEPNNHFYTLLELPLLGSLNKDNIPLTIGDSFSQEDINLNRITYDNSLSEAATDSFKVNVLNASSAWLPNIIIPITIENSLELIENNFLDVVVYPNPSTGIISINWKDNLETFINVIDLQGRIILTKKINDSTTEINLNSFSEGIYLVSIQNEKTKVTKKIVLEK
ncbi:MAG: T9SS type A sorting domain-containing protein, partial [Flavobacterium sp.]|nr:T9SS type A sorting domain-containing protein [Flavobacterium sp.]